MIPADRLDQVIADLDLLNRSTERDFLRIGGKLGEFIEGVSAISSDLASLSSAISGEQGERASVALTAALDRSLEMEARYAASGGCLESMRVGVRRLGRTLDQYGGTVSILRVLGFMTRIEIARIGTAAVNFASLTEDVRCLAENVQAKVRCALDAGAELIPTIESVAQDISVLQEEQLKDLPSLISAVSTGLSSLRENQDQAHAISVRLAKRYAAISEAVGKLVVSIQFHDITRQQVEHVIQALRRLGSESPASNPPASNPPASNSGNVSGQAHAAAALALQASQLSNAAEKFATSVDSLVRHLDEISEHVSAIAVESRHLSGDSGDENDPFLLRMDTGCAAILARIRHCAHADTAALKASSAVCEMADQMHRSVEELRAIEIRMVHVAINARINANSLGPDGDPLGILAERMGRQAFESKQHSGSLVEVLHSIRDAAARMSEWREPASAGEVDSHGSHSEALQTAIAEMRSSSESNSLRISQVIACADRLRENLSATCAEFTAGALFAEAVGRARTMIDEIGAECGSSSDGGAPEPVLADFAVHYTMQSERDVYESIAATGGVASTASSPAPEPQAEEESELGDVEFF